MPAAKAPTNNPGNHPLNETVRPQTANSSAIWVVRTEPYRPTTDPASEVRVMAPLNTIAEYSPTWLASTPISAAICGASTGTVMIAIATATWATIIEPSAGPPPLRAVVSVSVMGATTAP